MRGDDIQQSHMFSYLSAEQRVPEDHPLRAIKVIVEELLKGLSPEFSKMYSREGRPSIAPEKLLKALLLQAFFTIRSERMLMEQLQYNMLFRWFVGLNMDDEVWVPTTFTKNRNRLMEADVAAKFFQAVTDYAGMKGLLSDEHFTVDGTLIQGWASQKSFQPKAEEPAEPSENSGQGTPTEGGRNAKADFHGENRSNKTHESKTDPDTRLCRKGRGKESRLCYQGHALMENRHGIIVKATVTIASGTAEREAALDLIEQLPGKRARTLGADKGYDCADFVAKLRSHKVTPHIASKTKGSAVDGRTTSQPGYAISQQKRKLVEEGFGWLKTVGKMRQTLHRGVDRVNFSFLMAMSCYNLVRTRNILAQA